MSEQTRTDRLTALFRRLGPGLDAVELAEALAAEGVDFVEEPVRDEQPIPVDNGRPHVMPRVLQFMLDRYRLGIHRYGVGLQAFNRRRSIRDAREELADGLAYLTQFEQEQEEIAETALALLREMDRAGLGSHTTIGPVSRRLRELLRLAGY